MINIVKYGDGPYHLDIFFTTGLFERAPDGPLHILCDEDQNPIVFETEDEARDYIDKNVSKDDLPGYQFTLVTA